MRKLFTLLLTALTIVSSAQTNFTYSPENPKAGDLVSFSYEPAGDIANTISPVEAVAYVMTEKGQKAIDIPLKKNAGKYTGSFTVDTAGNFVFFNFTSNKKSDNNFNKGYWVLLSDGAKPVKGSYASLGLYYLYYGSTAGVEKDNAKAIAAYDKEFELYPDSKKNNLITYLRVYGAENKETGPARIQKEIESQLKSGLKDESDYTQLESLYGIAKLPQQAKMITDLKKEKYPNGKWQVTEAMNKFYNEMDPVKKQALLDDIIAKINTDENYSYLKPSVPSLKSEIAYAYYSKKDWAGFHKAIETAGITDKTQLSSLYNNAAWEMQKDSSDLKKAEEMSRFATENAKAEWKNPSSPKPDYLTASQWESSRKGSYQMYADTYAMIMYRMGNYKKGFPYTKESAIELGEGKSADENTTYALLAEKTQPVSKYKPQLEQFVKDGKSSSVIDDILKKAYIKQKKSDEGFDDYIAALQKESQLKMMEELRKSMLNETAPSFALYNLDGNKISLSELKGKVVVVDFWATWCGPCKASFPGMQKTLNKYKDDPNVKFVFVDTWERGEEKKKNAQEFITKNKYSFDVLMDDEDKVIAQYKVDGIPTKFVIDKEGKIRFKAVGFSGSDDKLMTELTAMIEMAGNTEKKAF